MDRSWLLRCVDFWKEKTRGAFEVDVVPVLVQYLETRNACATDIRGHLQETVLSFVSPGTTRRCRLPQWLLLICKWKAQSCWVALCHCRTDFVSWYFPFRCFGFENLSGQCGWPLRWHCFSRLVARQWAQPIQEMPARQAAMTIFSSVSLGVGSQLLVWRRKRLGHWYFRILWETLRFLYSFSKLCQDSAFTLCLRRPSVSAWRAPCQLHFSCLLTFTYFSFLPTKKLLLYVCQVQIWTRPDYCCPQSERELLNVDNDSHPLTYTAASQNYFTYLNKNTLKTEYCKTIPFCTGRSWPSRYGSL